MEFKKNSNEVFARLTELYTGKGMDKIYAKMKVNDPALDEFKKRYSDRETVFPDADERVNYWDKALSIYTDIEDDSIPNCYMAEFDQGLSAALFGAEVKFLEFESGWISSMVDKFVDDLDEVRDWELDENNEWFRLYKNQMSAYLEKINNRYGIGHLVVCNGLNFLIDLVGGTQAYYEVYDNPEKVRFVIDFSVRMNKWLQKAFFDTVGSLNGGTSCIYASWLPGKIVSDSVDPFHMTSAEMFEEWGKEPIERFFSGFDGGVIHIHSNGRHLIEKVVAIKGIKCIYIGDEDFNPPHAYEILDELSLRRGAIPASITVSYEIFKDMLNKKELPTNMLYDVREVPDIESANRTMELVRSYRR